MFAIKMEKNKNNPKALNLEIIQGSKNKVTLGFKCNPQIKLNLVQESQKLGITLSEHVENLIMNTENLKEQLKNELKEVRDTLKEQNQKIEFYENDFLKDLFNKYKSQKVNYINAKNEKITTEIKDITDVYTIIINSFKVKN